MNNVRKQALLVVDDEQDAADIELEILADAGYEVFTATTAEAAKGLIAEHFIDLLLLDERLKRSSGTVLLSEMRQKYPGLGGILITGYADVDCAVRAMRAGAMDLLQKPIRKEALLDAVSRSLAQSQVTRDARYNRWMAERSLGFPDIIGESPALQRVLSLVRQIAATDAPVLIQGESGTGKELIARSVHACSSRRMKPFIAVNAGAIPPTLMESTLFGSKRGAYTDSRSDQPGLFEAADGGTLFLDEIGDITSEVQVRLLRVIQEKSVLRVGEVTPRAVNARIVAATNRDLRVEQEQKRFRADLYYRLAVVTIELPPLRERDSDIEPIARYLLEKHCKNLGRPSRGFTPQAIAKLRAYRWPGNIRELDNVIQRAVILVEDELITPGLLLLDHVQGSNDLGALADLTFRDAQLSFERIYFKRLLERTLGNKTKAADKAGIDRTALHAHLKKIGLRD